MQPKVPSLFTIIGAAELLGLQHRFLQRRARSGELRVRAALRRADGEAYALFAVEDLRAMVERYVAANREHARPDIRRACRRMAKRLEKIEDEAAVDFALRPRKKRAA